MDTFASPVITRYLLMLQLGELFSSQHQVPIYTAG